MHGEIVLVLVEGSLESEVHVSENVNTQDVATDQAVFSRSLQKQNPIEIVSLEEVLEVNSLLNDTLLLGGIEASSIDECQLEISGEWVAVGISLFVSEIISGNMVCHFWFKSESISSVVFQEWIHFLGGFCDIPLIDSIIPFLYWISHFFFL